MDVKLSSPSISSSSGKQFDFCDDDLSEHGYGSLEDLNCPSNVSSMIQGCDDVSPSSSSLPTAITTTTLTSSSPSSLSSSPSSVSSSSLSSSIDSIACLNNSSKSTESSSVGKDHSKLSQQPKATHPQDSNINTINVIPSNNIVLENSLDNCSKELNNNDNRFQDTSSGESRNDQKLNDGKVHSPLPQMLRSGNRFKFVPKNRQSNDGKCKGAFPTHNGRNNNGRSSRKGDNRDQENRKRSQMRHKNNDDVVFIIRKVDRSLRRTVSESSGETLPVRGILKYPRGWNRRTLSESNCDNSEQSNLMDSHENGQTQSLECISPLDEVSTCEASTESASSLIGESHDDHHDEEKPKKSVHFNCYVSKATFNINSTILNNNNNNKHAGSNNNPNNKKKNRRQNNNSNNIPPSTYNHKNNINDRKNTSTNPTKPNSSYKDNHLNKQSNDNLRVHKSQPLDHHVPSNSQPKNESNNNKPFATDKQSVNCDSIVIDSVVIISGDKLDQSENIDPIEAKLRSRQDSGYDSETSDKRNSIEDSGTTCVKSPNRQFTVQKVDLN